MRRVWRDVRQPRDFLEAQGSERQLPAGDQSGCVRDDVQIGRVDVEATPAGTAAGVREETQMIAALLAYVALLALWALLDD
jgi:hypothetical protein